MLTIRTLALILLLLMPGKDGVPDDSKAYLQIYLQEAVIDMTLEEQTDYALDVMRVAMPKWRHKYRRGTFDCSEMSACVCWCLNQFNIPAEINYGQTLKTKKGHAWVEIYGKEEIINVQATTLKVVGKDAFRQYNVKYLGNLNKTQEWDWWQGDYIQDRHEWAEKRADNLPANREYFSEVRL